MPTAIYVSKFVSVKEWDEHYRHHNSYFKIGELGATSNKQLKIAFVGYDSLAEGCQFLTDSELRSYDDHCRANHLYPRPFEKEGEDY